MKPRSPSAYTRRRHTHHREITCKGCGQVIQWLDWYMYASGRYSYHLDCFEVIE